MYSEGTLIQCHFVHSDLVFIKLVKADVCIRLCLHELDENSPTCDIICSEIKKFTRKATENSLYKKTSVRNVSIT